MSEREPPFRVTSHVSFDASDPAGVLFYGNVFALAHRAFERMVEAAGIPWSDWFDSARWAVPVTRASADFSAPLTAGQAAEIAVAVKEIRESGCAIEAIFSTRGTACARVESVHVFVDRTSGEKRAIPPEIREKLERFQVG